MNPIVMTSDDEKQLLIEDRMQNNIKLEASKTNNRNLYLTTGVMLFGSLAIGLTLGMSSPMIPSIQNDKSRNAIKMKESDYSWFGSLLTVGGIVGGLVGGFMIQTLGRKPSCIVSGIAFCIGIGTILFSRIDVHLLLGRALTGFAAGIARLVVPNYISEISTEKMRGFLGSGSHLTVVVGLLLSYVCGNYMHWRWLAVVIYFPCAIWSFLSFFVPESPRFLLMKRKTNDAEQALLTLRGESANIKEEMIAIEENIRATSDSATWTDVFVQKSIRIPFLLTLGLAFFRQLNGQLCLIFYAKSLFKVAGLKTEQQLNIATIAYTCTELIFTLVPLTFLNQVGRKILLVASGLLVAFGSGIFGLCVHLQSSHLGQNSSDIGIEGVPNHQFLNWVSIATLMVYVSGYSIGMGPVFWLLMSEIIPLRARGKASAVATSANWFFGFLVTKEFFYMEEELTLQGTFWTFSVISVIGVVFYWLFIPETKGKTLEEISMYFEGVES